MALTLFSRRECWINVLIYSQLRVESMLQSLVRCDGSALLWLWCSSSDRNAHDIPGWEHHGTNWTKLSWTKRDTFIRRLPDPFWEPREDRFGELMRLSRDCSSLEDWDGCDHRWMVQKPNPLKKREGLTVKLGWLKKSLYGEEWETRRKLRSNPLLSWWATFHTIESKRVIREQPRYLGFPYDLDMVCF